MIRAYRDSDYEQLYELYQHGDWFGGVYDEVRDGRARLSLKIEADPSSIWVYEDGSDITGSISLVDDGRVAWLFRFVVKEHDEHITEELYKKAIEIFKSRGHTQVLAYNPVGDEMLAKRYADLGMTKGNSYTAYWVDI